MREIKFRAWDGDAREMIDDPFYEDNRLFLEGGALMKVCGSDHDSCSGPQTFINAPPSKNKRLSS